MSQVQTFIDYLNSQHNLNHHLRDYLPVEQIDLSYLINEKILDVNDREEIIFLDTSRIAKSYLDLNAGMIEEFTFLESLILGNLRWSVDCSKMPELTSLKVGIANRASSIYIAENKKISEFEIVQFEVDSTEQQTTRLLAHPDQIKKNFISSKIEKEYINHEGYSMVFVSLAPPGHRSMKSADKLPPEYLWRFDEADLGDILAAYWNLQPEYYTQFSNLEDCPEFQQKTYLLLKEIEKKVEAKTYTKCERSFNIREVEGKQFEWREFHDARPIPKYMFNTPGS